MLSTWEPHPWFHFLLCSLSPFYPKDNSNSNNTSTSNSYISQAHYIDALHIVVTPYNNHALFSLFLVEELSPKIIPLLRD